MQQTDNDVCNHLIVGRSGPGGVCYEEKWSKIVAIIVACHVESVVGSGATSIIVTCQRAEEPRRIHRRKWSRVVAITAACQGVVKLRDIHHRKWSRVVAITAAC